MGQIKHILMVDDVTTNLRCVCEILKDTYRVSMVKSGAQALDFLGRTVPDLILLDISMPDMDGYETLERIKELENCSDIPIIFLTADTDDGSEARGYRMGAADYIRKPFEPGIMLRRIEQVLQTEKKRKEETENE